MGCFLACACEEQPADRGSPPSQSVVRPPASLAPAPPPPVVDLLARERELLEHALKLPAAPGAPGFDARRAELVGRAKGEPVLFVRTPEYLPSSSAVVQAERQKLGLVKHRYWKNIAYLIERYRFQPQLLRQMLLRDGYLYAEHPDFAFSLLSLVSPQHLFGELEIWVQRGERTMRARRQKGHYRYTSGPHEGGPVRLMHLDRIGVGEPPAPLHRDIRSLKYRLHFDRAAVRHLTDSYIVLDLFYGQHRAVTVVSSDGPRLELEGELLEAGVRDAVQARREQNRLRQALLQGLRQAALLQINERLPFDEPKTEEGQEDGKLRRQWRYAYLEGRKTYRYNGDRYRVFGPGGAPLIPQVCIDFILDTFERASGTWWLPADGPRARVVGGLDFNRFDREHLRRTENFLLFAREHSDWFDVYDVPPRERIQLGYKPKFFRYLRDNVEHFQPGDLVFIRGYTPWDEEHMHTHAFMVYESDPLTRMPIVIAGNPGPANLWSWETEARRTPQRELRHRVRPKTSWLASAVKVTSVDLTAPPVLVPTRP